MLSYVVLRRRYADPPAAQLALWTESVLAGASAEVKDGGKKTGWVFGAHFLC